MDTELIEELGKQVTDRILSALLEAYAKESTASAVATKALEVLEEEVREIDKP